METGLSSPGFSSALVILAAAGLVIPTFARFRISPVIGFILVGIAVGPFGLGAWAHDTPWLSHITIKDVETIAPVAELGVVLLLFSIGLELSLARMWRMRRELIGYGGAELAVSGLIIALALMLVGTGWAAALGLGLALALSSTALVLPIAGTTTPVGKLALAMLLFEDLALVPILFLLGALATGDASQGWVTLAKTAGLGGLVVVGMLAIGRYALPPLFAQAARTKSPELFLSASLLVAIVSGLATAAVGLSPIVGALVAGLLIAETKYSEEVEAVTEPLRGLALGVFLISVGMSLDLGLVGSKWQLVLGAVILIVLIKTAVTHLLLRAGGVSRSLAAETSILMASPSETTLIVLGVATLGGLINRETASFWQAVTAIGLTITPLLAKIGHEIARRIDGHHAALQDFGDVDASQRTILIGFGRVGQMVGEMLERHSQPYIAIEANVDIADAARRAGKPVLFGDAARPSIMKRLNPKQAKAIVLTMDDPVQAERMTKMLRERHSELPIIARARDVYHAATLFRAGATDVVPETLESSLQLSEAVLVDLGVAMGPVIASIHEKRDELRQMIKETGLLEVEPRLGPLRRED